MKFTPIWEVKMENRVVGFFISTQSVDDFLHSFIVSMCLMKFHYGEDTENASCS